MRYIILLLLLPVYIQAQKPKKRTDKAMIIYGTQPIILKVPKGNYVYYLADSLMKTMLYKGFVRNDTVVFFRYRPPGHDSAWLVVEGGKIHMVQKIIFKPARVYSSDSANSNYQYE